MMARGSLLLLAWMIALVSLMMGVPWLVIEPIMIWRGKISGDLSGLWFLSKWPTLLIILVLVGSRIAILLWAG